jgi:sulfate transport system substrate-binding protein
VRRLLPLLLLVPILAACGSAGASSSKTTPSSTTLNLVAYSTPQPVMEKLISQWKKTPAGSGVSFAQSYGSSGSQARAVVAGQACDIAFLSTGLDIDAIASAGALPKNWTSQPSGGIVADSVVAFAVRPGNPKNIHTWADLVKPGVKVVTPDPFSSGSAKWNVLAAYGAQRKLGQSDAQAQAYVQKLFGNVVQQDSSGSNAMSTFLSGKGDVLLTYESEAYNAIAAGSNLEVVIPPQTMLIELPMVATTGAPAAANAFIQYAHTAAAQTVFAENGYRPVVTSALKQPALSEWSQRFSTTGETLFPISDPLFGGWEKANTTWFAANGRMLAIEHAVGGPTS